MDDILSKIKSEIIVPIIGLLFAVAILYFMWGVVMYLRNLNNPTGRSAGQKHMVWGIIGLAIMLSAFGIVNFVFNTVTAPNGTTLDGIDGNPIQKPDILQEGQF